MQDEQSLRAGLARCYGGILHDVMRARGLTDFTLPPTLTPLEDCSTPLFGPAFTMLGRPQPGAGEHATLLAWTGFLSRAPSGHVVVIQPNDNEVAHMGELSAETLKLKGVAGVVVDGGARDVSFIRSIGLPVWSRYRTPRDVVNYWLPEAFDVPVQIGAVRIVPGDWIFADADGVLCLPQAHAQAVVARSLELIETENLVRRDILQGIDPQEAYLRHRKF
ncbi:RraA family protein [Roseateles sp. BYS180W]|uniref:Putative 4-hydroxy-4-methyl-2-oxoglutarate aldolase n=1 Tax=Roseateles rivi TaxID=3299028 RepID=A0ABW7FWF2_9BURK